jgi:hypothetical protein
VSVALLVILACGATGFIGFWLFSECSREVAFGWVNGLSAKVFGGSPVSHVQPGIAAEVAKDASGGLVDGCGPSHC